MNKEQKEREKIKKFISHIKKQIADGKKEGLYKPLKKKISTLKSGQQIEYDNGYFNNKNIEFEQKEVEDWSEVHQKVQADIPSKINNLKISDHVQSKIISGFLYNKKQDFKHLEEVHLDIVLERKAHVSLFSSINSVGISPEQFSFKYENKEFKLEKFKYEDWVRLVENEKFDVFHGVPGFYLTIKFAKDNWDRYAHHNAACAELDYLKIILSLLRVGSVFSGRYDVYLGSVGDVWISGGNYSYNDRGQNYKYELTTPLLNFLKRNYGLLRDNINSLSMYNSEKIVTPVSVAYEMYNDAILERKRHKQISYAIMGLEALYTENEPQLKQNLKMRAGKVMHDLTGKDLRELISKAYDVRSSYAHGNVNLKDKMKKAKEWFGSEEEFAISILDILRVSIVVALFYKNESKDFMRSTIDDFLIKGDNLAKTHAIPKALIRNAP